jgi:type VI secretion system protein ImpB
MANKAFNNAQKFIGRNRAPRVQIEYDVEIYGSERKIELPFVMAVLSDLSGKPVEPLPPISDRKFLDIDIDNFDERMKAIKPRVAFSVPNTLTGEGYLMVDMTFERMDDFSPAAVAKKVDALNQLLEARTQLFNLQTYMDGKSGAEGLINQLLQDPALMKALASTPKQKATVPETSQADGTETGTETTTPVSTE